MFLPTKSQHECPYFHIDFAKKDFQFVIFTNQFSSIVQLCLTFCDPMDCSTPGFPVHHQLPELAQTPVYRVGDVI